MKRSHIVGAIGLTIAGMMAVAVPMFGLTDMIVQYADRLRSGEADFIAKYYLQSLLIYFVLYAASVGLCLPLAALMSAAGGWLFGLWSLPPAVLAILLGSIPPFMLSRRYAGPALAKIDSANVARFRRGFERNQFQYLILLRLVPWAPFTVTTIVAGALGMNLTKFLAGTVLGFIPAGLAFNAIGHGLARLSDLHSISAAQLYRDPGFLIALGGVSAVVLLSLSRRIPFFAKLFN